jgi:hypothetical protein
MAVPFDRITSEALENFGNKKAYDNLAAKDGIVRAFGMGGGIQLAEGNKLEIVSGGQSNFVERTMYGQNTNIAHRSKSQEVSVTDDEGYTLIKVPMRLIDGAIVYNQQERDSVAGDWAIAEGLIQDKFDQFNTSWVQVIATALRQAVPGALDPFTLLPSGTTGTVNGILIPRTPAQQATDAATTAGISRGDNSWWRNQYSNTSYALQTVAGQAALYSDVYAACMRGMGVGWEPNIGICGNVVLGSLGATITNNARASYQDSVSQKSQIGRDSIMFYKAEICPDSSTRFVNGSASKLALINTNGLKIKVLRGQGNSLKGMLTQDNGMGSLPVFWKEGGEGSFVNDPKTLLWIKLGYLTYNLVPKSLQDHGLADNCT